MIELPEACYTPQHDIIWVLSQQTLYPLSCLQPLHSVRMSTSTRGGQKRMLDPLELQLQVFMSYLVLVLSLKLQSSARATSALHANAELTDIYPHTQRFTWVLGI